MKFPKRLALSLAFASMAAIMATSLSAANGDKFTWCTLGVVNKEARLSTIFMAADGKGHDVVAGWFKQATGHPVDREFQCKQFDTREAAQESISETVTKLRGAGYKASSFNLRNGQLIAL